ncbi:tRNA (uracil-O(2)-)-methyltransferase [Penicillium chermesinum]|uniref:tRNA (uracil-O(2)-)-methyltransferase n=1 Tax=Penicillium chermesinum TaxID=63820 RepID=A0A9W9PKN0_9EURO|nr:tRNA (uracil-O(2)-)-methyltransferase [Penicillium chermesinum]KAJ5249166.1 tRNA (uracil-O(2)-)-methyltransferase [Penicillium chermesinum]
MVYLTANPNVTSSLLFRADILFDSEGLMQTPEEKEEAFGTRGNTENETQNSSSAPKSAMDIQGFKLIRTVVRRLIPRNPALDKPLEQTCLFYTSNGAFPKNTGFSDQKERLLLIYLPHVESIEEMPFYHPALRGLAYLYDFHITPEGSESGSLSLHFLPFTPEIPNRLERTLLMIHGINVKMSRNWVYQPGITNGADKNPEKDNLIPRHRVQNTYTRLKAQYASDLCSRWAEKTDPVKHVFEDLAITAFLLELWRSMYGVNPPLESPNDNADTARFPGFVDVACGNGVLVHVLIMEGYSGWGKRLVEKIYIPKPFADVADLQGIKTEIHTGDFAADTFIISNHADELTVWTPLMAALACPTSPLPFISIPCCSHSLLGARFRYPPPRREKRKGENEENEGQDEHDPSEQNAQPASGDLRALRAAKEHEKTEDGHLKSQYGSLTAKTMSIAEEAGYEVEKTLLRIPSTRNMGVIGGRRRVAEEWKKTYQGGSQASPTESMERDGAEKTQKIMSIIEEECIKDGGLELAARKWIERAQTLTKEEAKPDKAHGS